eukprot:1020692-Rhodomonas_salina.1
MLRYKRVKCGTTESMLQYKRIECCTAESMLQYKHVKRGTAESMLQYKLLTWTPGAGVVVRTHSPPGSTIRASDTHREHHTRIRYA